MRAILPRYDKDSTRLLVHHTIDENINFFEPSSNAETNQSAIASQPF